MPPPISANSSGVKIIDHESAALAKLEQDESKNSTGPVKIIDKESAAIAKLQNAPAKTQADAKVSAFQQKPVSLDARPFFVVSKATTSLPSLERFAQKIELGFKARVKEFFHLGSATGEVKRAANQLNDTLRSAMRLMGFNNNASSELQHNYTDRIKQLLDGASELSTTLHDWLAKHDRPGASPAEKQRINTFKDLLSEVDTMIHDLADTASDAKTVRDTLFEQNLPKGFPLESMPYLKEMMLEHIAEKVVEGAKDPTTFMRGNDAKLYTSAVKHAVTGTMEKELKSAHELNRQSAKAELKNHPEWADMHGSSLMKEKELRHAVAQDYQKIVTTFFGPDATSAKEAASRQSPLAMAYTAHAKRALDKAVAAQLISREEADASIRKLVINNFFLRSINPTLVDPGAQPGDPESQFAAKRIVGISKLLQNDANDVTHGGDKEAELKDLNDLLAVERAKVNAFIDGVIAQLG